MPQTSHRSLLFRVALANLVFLLTAAWSGAGEVESAMQYEINPQTGMLSKLRQGETSWLSAETGLSIKDEMNAKREFVLAVTADAANTAESASYQLTGEEFAGKLEYRNAGDHLVFSVEFTYKGEKDFGATVAWNLPLALAGTSIFLTDEENHHVFDELREPLEAGYPLMAFPMWTAYRQHVGGISVVRDPAEKITQQKFIVQPDGQLTMEARNIWMKPGVARKFTYFVFFHGGDWRCAVRWFADKYRDWLELSLPKALETDGPMSSWRPIEDDELQDCAAQDLTWWEVHGTYPFYGKYVSETEPYHWAQSDRYTNLRAQGKPGKSVAELGEPDQTHEQVRDFIRRLHGVNAQALIYWNQNDCWTDFAKEKFPEAIGTKNTQGDPWIQYEDTCILMTVEPQSKWSSYILDQVDQIIATYPELDGIFNDQVCYFHYDYARQDGISMVQGVPVYNNRFGYIAFTPKVVEKLHPKNLSLWGNGCYTVDVGRYFDGIMAEGGSAGMERSRFLGILGKPVCILTGISEKEGAKGWEKVLKRSLISGVQPSVVRKFKYPNTLDWKQERRRVIDAGDAYRPFFRQLRGKRWVLTENALELPAETEGNIFVDPQGRGIVTLVTWDASYSDQAGELYNRKIAVRFDDASHKGVYLTSPAWPGKMKLNCAPEQGVYRLTLPVHRSATVVNFEKTGAHLALTAESCLSFAPGKQEVVVSLDNLTAGNLRGTLTVEYANKQVSLPCEAAAGESRSIPVQIDTADAWARGAEFVPVTLVFTADNLTVRETSAVLLRQPLVLSLANAPVEVEAGKQFTLTARITNLAYGRQEQLLLEEDGALLESIPLTLSARSESEQTLSLTAGRRGIASLRVSVGDASREAKVEILSQALQAEAELGKIARTWFKCEATGSGDGKYAKPILLNGREVAKLARCNAEFPDWAVTKVEIPPESFPLIRQTNTLALQNPGVDYYGIRNVCLELLLADGTRVFSSLQPQEHRSSTAGLELGSCDFTVALPLETAFPAAGAATGAKLTLEYALNPEKEQTPTPELTLNGATVAQLSFNKANQWETLTQEFTPENVARLQWGNRLEVLRPQGAATVRCRNIRLEVTLADGRILRGGSAENLQIAVWDRKADRISLWLPLRETKFAPVQ